MWLRIFLHSMGIIIRTFIENPEGCMFLGHSKSVVCIRTPDSNKSITFRSGLCVCMGGGGGGSK